MPGLNVRLSAEAHEATGSWPGRGGESAPVEPAGEPGSGSGSGRRSSSGGSGPARPASGELPSLPVPGERLESFEIHEAIGSGGMGAVFLATDTRLDREVALKVLPPEQSLDAETVRRFYLEGKAAARLDHENIARVYTIGQDRGLHFIAFEYVEGTTLRQRVEQRGVLSPAEAVDVSLQIAEALIHAASRGVVHRDIKPSNIIVTPRGRAKLVDMGLARHFERSQSDHGLTQSGMTLGTFDYISPEQARDPRNVDVRSDLYSLGCTMYFLLTGRPPFPDGTVLQKLLQHQGDPAPDVRSLNPAVPEALALVILRLMEKDRERRYQTPEQLRDELAVVGRPLGVRSEPPASASSGAVASGATAGSWERHLVWAVPAIGLALVLAAVSLWGPGAEVAPRDVLPATLEPVTPRPRVTPAHSNPRVVAPSPAGAGIGPIRVGERDDLASVIARAASGSTIVLSEPGPYRLRASELVADAKAGPRRRHLTIRGESGVRPVVRADWSAADTRIGAGLALIDLGPGTVRVEGIEFDLTPPSPGRGERSALAARETELLVSECLFRGPTDGGAVTTRLTAVRVRGGSGAAEAVTRLVGCTFVGGLTAISGSGPVDLDAEGCRAATAGSFLAIDGGGGARSPADVRVRDLRAVAGEEPIFLLAGVDARLVVEGSALGPAGDRVAALVAIDDPKRLDWRGRENLYGRFATFLEPSSPAAAGGRVVDFDGWAGGTPGREVRSRSATGRLWEAPDPLSALAGSGEPDAAFRLALGEAATPAIGPSGPLARVSESISTFMSTALGRRQRGSDAETRTSGATSVGTGSAVARSLTTDEDPDGPVPMPVAGTETPLGPTVASDGLGGDRGAPMAQAPGSEVTAPLPPMFSFDEPKSALTAPTPGLRPGEVGRSGEAPESRPAQDRDVRPEGRPAAVRTRAEWLAAIAELSGRGGVIRLASDARLALATTEVPRGGRWIVQAEPGASRPRIRLASEVDAARVGDDSPPLFRLAAGAALELRDVDLVIDVTEQPTGWSGAGLLLGAGSDLSLIRCTLTLVPGIEPVGDSPALLRVGPTGPSSSSSPVTIRVEDCFLRTGGSFVVDPAAVRLDVTVTGSVVLAAGVAFEVTGASGGPTASDRSRVTLRQSLVRAAGGLARLRGRVGRSDPPLLEVSARDTILATTPRGDPLLRIEGRDDTDTPRDRVLWDGRGVVYHLIEVYRLDETAAGAAPAPYRRLSWDVAVGPKDEAASHLDARFAVPMTSDQRVWRLGLDDVRLAPDSPVRNAGPRLDRVPPPPAAEER
jgi:serine/threonine-protein kinase